MVKPFYNTLTKGLNMVTILYADGVQMHNCPYSQSLKKLASKFTDCKTIWLHIESKYQGPMHIDYTGKWHWVDRAASDQPDQGGSLYYGKKLMYSTIQLVPDQYAG